MLALDLDQPVGEAERRRRLIGQPLRNIDDAVPKPARPALRERHLIQKALKLESLQWFQLLLASTAGSG